jgi:hypothetical protein
MNHCGVWGNPGSDQMDIDSDVSSSKSEESLFNRLRICGNLVERNGGKRIRRIHLRVTDHEIFDGEQTIPGDQAVYMNFYYDLIEHIKIDELTAGDFSIAVVQTKRPQEVIEVIRKYHPQIFNKYIR